MIREEKATVRRCAHRHPALVTTSEAGRRARCLGCGATGPWRASLAEALRALKLSRETPRGASADRPYRPGIPLADAPGAPAMTLEDGTPPG